MSTTKLESRLDGIQTLLAQLNGEVAVLEAGYGQVLEVLKKLEGSVCLDDLTGLLRRNAFFRKWEQLLEECSRLNEACGVLLIDIDHFKKVNDTHGHPTGDEVIRRVAGLLKAFEGGEAFAGRLGGEEFAVALRGTEAEILGAAELIRRAAANLQGGVIGEGGVEDPSVEWRCTVSIGAAAAGKSYDSQALLQSADQALYEAKHQGRNQVRAA